MCEGGIGVVKWGRVTFKDLEEKSTGMWDWLDIESTMGVEMILISHLRASSL